MVEARQHNMDRIYLGLFICLTGAVTVLGANEKVTLTFSNGSPPAGDNQVTLTCNYSSASPSDINYIYLDKLLNPHNGYTNLVKYDVRKGELSTGGSVDEANVVQTSNSITLRMDSVSCADTTNYKCDLTLAVHRHERNYHFDAKRLNVLDTAGKICAGSFLKSSSLFVLICIVLSTVFRQ